MERSQSMASLWLQQMLQGYTVIPNIVWQYFSTLNLTGDQFAVIVYVMSRASQTTSLQDIADVFGWEISQVMDVCDELVTNNYLDIDLKLNSEGKQATALSLEPFFTTIQQHIDSVSVSRFETEVPIDIPNLVPLFEKEFGRALTPIEFQKLNHWLIDDGYDPQLLHVALKEAVIREALNFNYIDKILINWRKRNIQTKEEAMQLIQRQSMPVTKPNIGNTPQIPLHEWHH